MRAETKFIVDKFIESAQQMHADISEPSLTIDLNETGISSVLRLFAQWACKKKLYLHIVLDGGSALVMQTSGIRSCASDIDVQIVKVKYSQGSKANYFDTPCAILGRMTGEIQEGRGKSFSVDMRYAFAAKTFPLSSQRIPFCSIRNQQGNGIFVSVVTLGAIQSGKKERLQRINDSAISEKDFRDIQLIDIVLTSDMGDSDVYSAENPKAVKRKKIVYQHYILA